MPPPVSPPPGSAPATTIHVPAAAVGSCQACPVRHYCALYVPHQTAIPANCPFGPGPDATPKAAGRVG